VVLRGDEAWHVRGEEANLPKRKPIIPMIPSNYLHLKVVARKKRLEDVSCGGIISSIFTKTVKIGSLPSGMKTR